MAYFYAFLFKMFYAFEKKEKRCTTAGGVEKTDPGARWLAIIFDGDSCQTRW